MDEKPKQQPTTSTSIKEKEKEKDKKGTVSLPKTKKSYTPCSSKRMFLSLSILKAARKKERERFDTHLDNRRQS